MNTIFCFLVLNLISPFASAVAGTGSTGGGFADRNGLAVLSEATRQLDTQLASLSRPDLLALPAGWSIDALRAVISAPEVRSTENRSREGRPLLLDYELPNRKIVALAPFFLTYGVFPEGQPAPANVRADLMKKLLHEASHLWGNDEAAAETFSRSAMSLFQRDVTICKVYGMGSMSFYYRRSGGSGFGFPVDLEDKEALLRLAPVIERKDFTTSANPVVGERLVDGAIELTFAKGNSFLLRGDRGAFTDIYGKHFIATCSNLLDVTEPRR